MAPDFLYKIYEKRLLNELDPARMPKHVAIIMDGNRRYTRVQGNMEVTRGHELGVDTLEKVLDWSIDLGIEIVTAYAFSTENFNRSEKEVKGLMDLFVKNFKRIVNHEKIHRNKVRVKVVGRLELLPDDVREAIQEAEDATKDYHDRLFNLAIGYDGRLEIVDAVKKIYKKIEAGELSIDDVDEKLINDNLYTEGLADPNLIILLWQSSYSELYFCDSLWPELRKIDYLRAIRDYQARDRRFGV